MPHVQVTIVAAANPKKHKHAVLRCGDRRIVLPVTSPKVDHSGFAANWQQVERPGEKPLLGVAGKQLHVARFEVLIARKDGSPVEDILVDLLNMSRDSTNVVTMHHYGYLESGPWRMTDFVPSSEMRLLGTNQITRARATVTLTEAVLEPGPRATKKKSGGSGKGDDDKKSRPKTYTVKAGDTLSGIAARFYGDANEWHKIAKANNIRSPRRLRIGQVLKLP